MIPRHTMTVLVPRTSGNHIRVIHDVALAVAQCEQEGLDGAQSSAWQAWATPDGGNHAVLVKQTTQAKLLQAADEVPGTFQLDSWVEPVALACPPVTDDERHPVLVQASLTGWTREGWDLGAVMTWPRSPMPTILVNADLRMTTGKAAAQAAHAAFRIGMHRTDARIIPASEGQLLAHADIPGAVVIRDSGRTEIPAGSLTVVGLPAGWSW